MNIKFYMVDVHACGVYRGELVAREINSQTTHRMDCKTNIMFSDYPGTNVMVFQRQNKNLESVKFANKRGITTIYEIDDDIWNIPQVFESYGTKFIKPESSEGIMRECDAITVTTPELADVVREHVPGSLVYVVPNAIDLDMWDEVLYERTTAPAKETVTIGWMASQSHLMDVPIVGEVLRDLMVKHAQLRLHFIGWIGVESFMGDMMRPFKDRIIYGDWVPVSQLGRSMSDFDIGILPLVDHPWNRSKSELKYLQYSALAIPSVASPLPCYLRAMGNNPNTGLIAQNNAPGSWYSLLNTFIEDREFRRDMGAQARKAMYLNHDIRNQFYNWLDVFEKVRKR